MTLDEWGLFAGFVGLLIGLSFVDHQLAVIAGIGVAGIIFYQYVSRGSKPPASPQTTGQVNG